MQKKPKTFALRLIGIFFFILVIQGISAKNVNTDSLVIELAKTKQDTSKIKILLSLSFSLRATESDKALEYANTALRLSQKNLNKKTEAKAFNNIGLAYFYKSNYDSAQIYYGDALKIGIEISDSSIISLSYSQMGNVYKALSNVPLSIEYHKKALRIREHTKDTILTVQSYSNLGNAYVRNNQYELAMKNFFKGLELIKTKKETPEYANALGGIGNVFLYQKNYKKAIEYFSQCYSFYKEQNDMRGLNTALLNLGDCYKLLKNYDTALVYLQQAIKINEKIKNKQKIAESYLSIGSVYEETNHFRTAVEYSQKAVDIYKELALKPELARALLDLAQKFLKLGDDLNGRIYLNEGLVYIESIKNKEVIISTYQQVAQCYSLLDDNFKAYHYLQKASELQDSLFTANSIQAIAQMQSAFDLKSKENEIELLNKGKEISDYKISRQQNVIFSLLGGALLIILLVFFILRGYRKTKRVNVALSDAYKQINEKNKNISDSIQYAKNIQNALLRIPKYFDEQLRGNYFILYKPKDVVSGDFYWIEQYDKLLLVAAADCTGHGVPGSLMSMLGIEKLKQAVREKGFTKPDDVLSFVNRSFKETLSINGTEAALRDGMDIALCCIDLSNNKVHFAGANRPMWISTTNENGEKTLQIINATKAAIGGFTDETQQFQSHTYSCKKSDTIYLFTDGFTDQFGGDKNKKYNIKHFRELLSSFSDLSMDKQKQRAEAVFNDWKANNEQVDDVLIIGIKIA